MHVVKRIRRANEKRKRRFQNLLEQIAVTNDMGLSDENVLAILSADHGV